MEDILPVHSKFPPHLPNPFKPFPANLPQQLNLLKNVKTI